MFKPLPADPALLQRLRIRNRIASLTSFAIFILWPIVISFIPYANPTDYEAMADYSALMILIGFCLGAVSIPASVFFFAHAVRYKKLIAYLGTNPAVYPATNPAPSDLSKLRGKKVTAIVWHLITLFVPVLWFAAAVATNGYTGAVVTFIVIGAFLVMFALTGGLAFAASSINDYLTFKAQLGWAFPDAQSWSPVSTTKTS